MDKNTIIGIVVMVALVVGFNFYSAKNQAELDAERVKKEAVADSLAALSPVKEVSLAVDTPENIEAATADAPLSLVESIKDSLKNLELSNQYGIFMPAAKGSDDFITFENKKFKGRISKKGGYIAEIQLKGYQTYNGDSLIIFTADSSFYSINLKYKNLETKDLYFTSASESFIAENETETIKLRLQGTGDKYIDYTYTFYPDDYQVGFDIDFHGLQSDLLADKNGLPFTWKQSLPSLEKDYEDQQKISTVYYYNPEEGRDYVSQTDNETENIEYPLDYIAMRHKFFTSSLIPQNVFPAGAELSTKVSNGDYFETLTAKTAIPFEAKEYFSIQNEFIFAPIDFNVLASYDAHLEDQIEFGWGIIYSMNEYFISPVFHFFVKNGMNVGLAILLITLLIKLILFPITYKNYLSSAKMRVIKPRLDKINEENKDADAVKKQQAVMQLYKETGVNPMAGCIPAILQMPILFAMFRFFPNAIGLRQESFLWASDLSTYDDLITWGGDIPFLSSIYGNHMSLFTVLMAISLFFYTRFNNQMTPSGGAGGEMQAKQMKIMMNFMPLMMLFVFNSSAAGLSYYYLLANLITISQTLIIKKFFVNEEAILAKIEQHKNKPMKTSKWQKKMQEIAEKQKKK
jgi:YidC/Oxa1 family membrane protein insertase